MIAAQGKVDIGQLTGDQNPERMNPSMMVGGRAVTEYLKRFYREKDAKEPNKLAPNRRTHFWNRRIGGSVNLPKQEGDGVVSVSISSPILPHKIKGGTINAKRVQYLTIPIAPEAYDRPARRFTDLFVVKSKKGNLLLVKPNDKRTSVPRKKFNPKKEAKRKLPKTERPQKNSQKLGLQVKPRSETTTPEGEQDGFTPYYLLRKSVYQKPWPDSIPTEKEVTDVFERAIVDWLGTDPAKRGII